MDNSLEVQYRGPRENADIQWADSLHGPFACVAEAVRFAAVECGLPWRVVDADRAESGIEYARGNADQPPADPPACPACRTNHCEHGENAWSCIDREAIL